MSLITKAACQVPPDYIRAGRKDGKSEQRSTIMVKSPRINLAVEDQYKEALIPALARQEKVAKGWS